MYSYSFIEFPPLLLLLMRAQCCIADKMSMENYYNMISYELTKAAVNCTSFIPKDMLQIMQSNDPPVHPTYGEMTVPLEFLLKCLHANLLNVNESSPFSYTLAPTIKYNIALNEVVSLGFDGILVTKAHTSYNFHLCCMNWAYIAMLNNIIRFWNCIVCFTLYQVTVTLEWNDTRLQWLEGTGIGNWSFPDKVFYPINDVWVPLFRLANCQSQSCVVKPQETKTLVLFFDGRVIYEADLMLRSTCNIDLTCMYFCKEYHAFL